MPKKEQCFACDECGEEFDEKINFCSDCGSNDIYETVRDIPSDDWFHIVNINEDDQVTDIFEVAYSTAMLGVHLEDCLDKSIECGGRVEIRKKKT